MFLCFCRSWNYYSVSLLISYLLVIPHDMVITLFGCILSRNFKNSMLFQKWNELTMHYYLRFRLRRNDSCHSSHS